MLTPDDITEGTLLTILRGHPCACGNCCRERYEQLKGMPFVVTGVSLPYIAAGLCHGNGGAIFDVRECEFAAVSREFVDAVSMALCGKTSVDQECSGK